MRATETKGERQVFEEQALPHLDAMYARDR
jgi:hypothetical protein